jgi:hypothetical protein
MKFSRIIAFAFICVSTAAHADTTVFGFTLDQPLVLPECAYKMIPPGQPPKLYDVLNIKETCFQEPRMNPEYGVSLRSVWFPPKEAPIIVKNWNFLAVEQDGKLVGIRFYTYGVIGQEQTLKTLTDKFGEPTRKGIHKVGNLAGATAEAIVAVWEKPDVVVHLDGVTDKLDLGEVWIETPVGAALRASWAAADESKHKQL